VTEILPADDPGAIDEAVRLLRAGEVVALPTDTVYGVAVDAFAAGGADRLFAAKQRDRAVAIPVLVAAPDAATPLVEGAIDIVARRWMERFWPGALTIVLPRAEHLRTVDLGGDAATIGLRCPDHRLVRHLCAEVGSLATTSANRHKEPTPPDAEGVAEALGDAVALVLDGGPCEGAPSTVVSVLGDEVTLLREGRIPFDDLIRLTR
jgi:tRNA threonylcarbamoyl adenosine modification protein (Sua5/YciO/YrdC/YwlC family)